MSRLPRASGVAIIISVFALACGNSGSPTAPRTQRSPAQSSDSGSTPAAWGPEAPPFNVQAVLRGDSRPAAERLLRVRDQPVNRGRGTTSPKAERRSASRPPVCVDFREPVLPRQTWQVSVALRRLTADSSYVAKKVREDRAPFGQPLFLDIVSLDATCRTA